MRSSAKEQGILGRLFPRRASSTTPDERAVRWIRNHRIGKTGIIVHTKKPLASHEQTGYAIPTLYAWGERALALELAVWEASVQRPDGAFCAVDGVPYTFDTAMAVRGFLAVLDEMPELESHIRRACDYVVAQIAEDGQVTTPSLTLWRAAGELLSDYGHIYVLPPLAEAGARLREPRFVSAAMRALNYYKRQPDLVEFKSSIAMLSHYFGYMMEALIDLGEVQLAREAITQAAAIQRPDGAIPAYPGAEWICSPGQAQLALAWYKLGERERADRALAYLEGLQNRSGGWYGSYGPGAKYFPDSEPAWAVKFYLDACLWRRKLSVGVSS